MCQFTNILLLKIYHLRISNELNQKLYEDGWINTVHNMTTEEIDSSGSTVYSQVLEKVEPKALGMFLNILQN